MAKKFDIQKQGFPSVADAYNSLLGNEENSIVELPVDLLDEIPQMFPINQDKVDQIADSIGIEGVGVIDPVVVRKTGERYEILSGRHRVRACKKIGKETVRCQIKKVNDTIARLILLSTNTDRNNDYSPMVYAAAYSEMIHLMKQLGNKAAVNAIAEQNGINRKQIYRYLRLNHLITGLQDWVQSRILTIEAAVELSFLSGNKQLAIVEHINKLGIGDSVISKHFKLSVTKNIRNNGETMSDEKFIKNIDKIIFGNYSQPEKTEIKQEPKSQPEQKKENEYSEKSIIDKSEEDVNISDEQHKVIEEEQPEKTPTERKMGLQAPKAMQEIEQEPKSQPEQKKENEYSENSIIDNSKEDVNIPDETHKAIEEEQPEETLIEKKMELQAPKAMPEIKIIEGGRNTEPCPYCQKTFAGEGYSFGADFGDTEPSVAIYIRKYETAYDLVFEGEKGNTSCRISYCPKCGRYLDGGI